MTEAINRVHVAFHRSLQWPNIKMKKGLILGWIMDDTVEQVNGKEWRFLQDVLWRWWHVRYPRLMSPVSVENFVPMFEHVETRFHVLPAYSSPGDSWGEVCSNEASNWRALKKKYRRRCLGGGGFRKRHLVCTWTICWKLNTTITKSVHNTLSLKLLLSCICKGKSWLHFDTHQHNTNSVSFIIKK